MSKDERAILAFFRRFQIKPNEMMFISNNGAIAKLECRRFDSAMQKLVDAGLVVRDRRKHAYFLTQVGYTVSLDEEKALARQ